MEYAPGGELFEYIVQNSRLEEKEACRFYHQLISGIEYIHSQHVVHRDLKPENLLLDAYKNLKIADFGLGNSYNHQELLRTACGSPCYAAPEMIAGQKYNGLMADIWSSGIVLFAMVCGYLPFEDPDTGVLYQKILEGVYEVPSHLSDDAVDLLEKVLNVDPEKRWGIEAIKSHKWMKGLKDERMIRVRELKGVYNNELNEKVAEMVEGYGLQRTDLEKNLKDNKHNNITATYYLLLNREVRLINEKLESIIAQNMQESQDRSRHKTWAGKKNKGLMKEERKQRKMTIQPQSKIPLEEMLRNINGYDPEKVIMDEDSEEVMVEHPESSIEFNEKPRKSVDDTLFQKKSFESLRKVSAEKIVTAIEHKETLVSNLGKSGGMTTPSNKGKEVDGEENEEVVRVDIQGNLISYEEVAEKHKKSWSPAKEKVQLREKSRSQEVREGDKNGFPDKETNFAENLIKTEEVKNEETVVPNEKKMSISEEKARKLLQGFGLNEEKKEENVEKIAENVDKIEEIEEKKENIQNENEKTEEIPEKSHKNEVKWEIKISEPPKEEEHEVKMEILNEMQLNEFEEKLSFKRAETLDLHSSQASIDIERNENLDEKNDIFIKTPEKFDENAILSKIQQNNDEIFASQINKTIINESIVEPMKTDSIVAKQTTESPKGKGQEEMPTPIFPVMEKGDRKDQPPESLSNYIEKSKPSVSEKSNKKNEKSGEKAKNPEKINEKSMEKSIEKPKPIEKSIEKPKPNEKSIEKPKSNEKPKEKSIVNEKPLEKSIEKQKPHEKSIHEKPPSKSIHEKPQEKVSIHEKSIHEKPTQEKLAEKPQKAMEKERPKEKSVDKSMEKSKKDKGQEKNEKSHEKPKNVEKPIEKPKVIEKPIEKPSEKPIEKPKSIEKPIIEKPIIEKPIIEKPILEKPIIEKQIEKPIEKPIEHPSRENPIERPKETPKEAPMETPPIETPIEKPMERSSTEKKSTGSKNNETMEKSNEKLRKSIEKPIPKTDSNRNTSPTTRFLTNVQREIAKKPLPPPKSNRNEIPELPEKSNSGKKKPIPNAKPAKSFQNSENANNNQPQGVIKQSKIQVKSRFMDPPKKKPEPVANIISKPIKEENSKEASLERPKSKKRKEKDPELLERVYDILRKDKMIYKKIALSIHKDGKDSTIDRRESKELDKPNKHKHSVSLHVQPKPQPPKPSEKKPSQNINIGKKEDKRPMSVNPDKRKLNTSVRIDDKRGQYSSRVDESIDRKRERKEDSNEKKTSKNIVKIITSKNAKVLVEKIKDEKGNEFFNNVF